MHRLKIWQVLAVLCLGLCSGGSICAQETSGSSAAKPAEKSAVMNKADEKAAIPFQIQLLETHIRFEANGDLRKEVHTIVKINDLLGARQFARLGFDYNRAYQQVEIPVVRVTHANGGTSEVLPSAVTDAPNPAVEKYPAYQDVRVKSVRVLGLQEGDTVEYRVITTTTKAPLAPDFWLEHSFDRSGQVLEEHYTLALPASREVQTYISSSAPEAEKNQTREGDFSYLVYRWKLSAPNSKNSGLADASTEPDIVLTTYSSWEQLATHIGERLLPNQDVVNELSTKAKEIARGEMPSAKWIPLLYEFVSQKIKTIDLPLGATGFRTRPPTEILSSGYGIPEDKFALFAALVKNCCGVKAGFVHSTETIVLGGLARPSVFDHILTRSGYPSVAFWMDLNLEVAPFGMIPPQFRGKTALLAGPGLNELWHEVPKDQPLIGTQKVRVDASVDSQGKLSAKVKYTLRGDNELLLRVAFHKTAKEKWKDVAGLLALSDGFRGVITSATASDPMATKDPFTVEYELTQEKFVDWSKKPVRIPALLPQIGLPDTTTKSASGGIELGTPLDVETQETLRLPAGTNVQTPAGTAVSRDYATYSSKYGSSAGALTAYRRVHFLQREVAADRGGDYGAFVQAVQNDQAQYFVLEKHGVTKAVVK